MRRIWIWGLVALLLAGILALGLGISDATGINGLFPAFTFGRSFLGSSWGSAEGNTAHGEETTVSEAIHTLQVDWVAGEVEIRFTDRRDIAIRESASRELKEEERLLYSVKGGALTIAYMRDGQGFLGLPWFRSVSSKSLVVEVPKDMNLRTLSVDGVSGNLSVGAWEGYLTEGRFDSVSGSIQLHGLSAKHLSIGTTSGDISLVGSFSDVRADSVSGSVKAVLTAAPDTLDADTVSGHITLTLPKNGNFTATFHSVSGKLHTNGFSMADSDRVTAGNGKSRLTLNTVSGSATLHMGQESPSGLENGASGPEGEPPLPTSNLSQGGREF